MQPRNLLPKPMNCAKLTNQENLFPILEPCHEEIDGLLQAHEKSYKNYENNPHSIKGTSFAEYKLEFFHLIKGFNSIEALKHSRNNKQNLINIKLLKK